MAGYSHRYGTSSFICTACRDAGGPDAGEWITINPDLPHQLRPDQVDGLKISLVVVPPDSPAGAGQIQLVHQGEVYGYIALALCGTCRRAVVQYLEVAEARRRRGVGRVLVAAARARCEGYLVTTAPLGTDPACTRFWAQVGLLGPPRPRPCRCQVDAGITGEGWETEAHLANLGRPIERDPISPRAIRRLFGGPPTS
ncbi:hypothetical protein AVL48_37570 [Amycolatopsis regifaucium]|uniref:N-acetyltransferase domain-containing protein n=2 Tax=Amycolatopsis regifaucium TaxID=546365 RepID=A0A154MDW2_9PSEU|nr:hypothetical protein AVL48_37570 [Amycolatopsis regifaucium]OKA03092.1 hypothetical protein ATP06_0238000 [Amycolatopsis regifaucium]SFJ73375.1 hypothetical protein SAMN04489731_13515 [Amycolatopsis regifaucium]